MDSTSPSALRSSTTWKGWPSGGSLGNSPCAETSRTAMLAATLKLWPLTAVVMPARSCSGAGASRPSRAGRVKT